MERDFLLKTLTKNACKSRHPPKSTDLLSSQVVQTKQENFFIALKHDPTMTKNTMQTETTNFELFNACLTCLYII